MTRRTSEPRPHPPVAIAHRPLDARWSRRLTDLTELVVLVTTAVLLASIAVDAAGPVRAVTALVVAAFLPGWTVCRVCGWHFSGSTVLTSFAVSVATMAIVGQVAVTRTDWSLETVGAVVGCICLAALAAVRSMRSADV